MAAIALVLGMNSCLDKYPGDYILAEDSLKTFKEAEQHLTGIYSAFMSSALYSGYLTLLPDIQADLVYAINGNSNTYVNQWQWDIRSTNPEIEAVYASLYTVIGECNFFLDKIGAVKASLIDDAEIEYLDYYTGEVYCARALAYSELIKLFCKAYDESIADVPELGVVLVTEYQSAEDGTTPVKRATLRESYQRVLDDLESAKKLLDEDNDDWDAAYFTNAAAHAIHARTALYMQDWETAIEESTKVIENKSFQLAKATTYVSSSLTLLHYMWLYDSSYENIWRIGYTETSFGAATGSAFLAYNVDYTYYYPDYVPAQWALDLYSSSDARYDIYFASLPTGYAHGLTWPLLTKYYGNLDLINKNIYHVNMPKPLRLAEQYLIRAEAYCQKKNPNFGAAAADLTKLRQARYVSGGSISVNSNNWEQTISDERVRELFMEGFRLQDLKRWGKGFERKPQNQSISEGSSLKKEAGDPLFVWPMPRHEIESPGSQIKPNESNK